MERLEVKALARSKDTALFTLGLPLVFLLLFGAIFAGTLDGTDVSPGQWFTPGIIAASVLSAGVVNLATSLAIERHDGTLKRLALTPLPTSSYLIGKILMTLIIATGMTVVLLATGALLFDVCATDRSRTLVHLRVGLHPGGRRCRCPRHCDFGDPGERQIRLGSVQPAIPWFDVHLWRLHRVWLDT